MLHATRKVPDLLIQQSQKEFEHMARLQQERAKDEAVKYSLETQLNQNEDLSEEEKIALENPPKKISAINFSIILFLAIIKDVVLDAMVAIISPIPLIGQVAYVGGWMIGVLITIIIFAWGYLNTSSRFRFKILLRGFMILIPESIPLLKDIMPSYIAFIIYSYLHQNKEFRKFEEFTLKITK